MESLLSVIKAVPVAFAALMPVINPIGTSLILLSLTPGASHESRKALARAIGLNTFLLLTVVLLGGSYLLSFFGISVSIVQFAGGLVLASMGWQLLNQKDSGPEQTKGTRGDATEDYSAQAFYPFTFPITVGPGCVAVALTLSAHTTRESLAETAAGQAGAILGFIGVSVVMYLCFVYSEWVTKKLGESGTSVLMRLVAFIVVCIGAQISWTGLSTLIHSLSLT